MCEVAGILRPSRLVREQQRSWSLCSQPRLVLVPALGQATAGSGEPTARMGLPACPRPSVAVSLGTQGREPETIPGSLGSQS